MGRMARERLAKLLDDAEAPGAFSAQILAPADALQVEQGEGLGKQVEGDGRVLELAAQPLHGHSEHGGMIEGESQLAAVGLRPDRSSGLPLPGDVQAREREGVLHRDPATRHEREVDDGEYPPARMAPRRSEGVQLLDVDPLQPGLLPQDAPRGVVERLVPLQEPAGNRIATPEGALPAAAQERPQRLVEGGQEDHVHRHREPVECQRTVVRHPSPGRRSCVRHDSMHGADSSSW